MIFLKLKAAATLYCPVVADVVKEAVNYLRSSARDYLGTKGILDIDILERPMSLEGYVFHY